MILWELFLGFLKVGAFTFGGGYGAVPLIREVVLANGWLTEESLTYMIAVSESTPGPIMVNMATYIGSSQGGFLGALVATAAVVLPSFAVILLIAALMNDMVKHPCVRAAMKGLKACVTGIILATGVWMTLGRCVPAGIVDAKATAIAAALGLILLGYSRIFGKKLSPMALIGIAACMGVLFYGV